VNVCVWKIYTHIHTSPRHGRLFFYFVFYFFILFSIICYKFIFYFFLNDGYG
jgi:hypothetical protein